MFESDRTCCVCHVSGRPVQIHHVDDDPANNEPSNLAVLCLECHDQTQIQGGFGRKLNSNLVTRYRDHWMAVVAMRRSSQHLTDELRVRQAASATSEPSIVMPIGQSGEQGQTYRNYGAVLTIIDLAKGQKVLVRGTVRGQKRAVERDAGEGAQYVSVATRVLNDAQISMDLTCGLPIQVKLFDDRDRMFDAIDGLDEIAGNPACNFNLQPGFEADMTWVFRVPIATRVVAFEFKDFTEWDKSDEREPTRIELAL
jgi:hypothetical protein